MHYVLMNFHWAKSRVSLYSINGSCIYLDLYKSPLKGHYGEPIRFEKEYSKMILNLG